MISKAEKANKVRDYFIILRKFIQYYKDYISNMIIENALKYQNGYVYIVLVNKGKNIFKLGKTKNVKNRLKNYSTSKSKKNTNKKKESIKKSIKKMSKKK